MGQKIHPFSLRLGPLYTWKSIYFAEKKDLKNQLKEDILFREFLKKELKDASIADIEIERFPKSIVFNIKTSKPGMVIGRRGEKIEEIKKKLEEKLFNFRTKRESRYPSGQTKHSDVHQNQRPSGLTKSDSLKIDLKLNIEEIKVSFLSAVLASQAIAKELERRLPFRKVVRQALEKIVSSGALGVKIVVSGRLDGADISRKERFTYGKTPFQTLRADIDYGQATAMTKHGTVGVKVWIYKGENI